MNKEKTNLTISPSVKDVAEKLRIKRGEKSLSSLVEKLVEEEVARDAKARAESEIAEVRRDILKLKEDFAVYRAQNSSSQGQYKESHDAPVKKRSITGS
jgi:predicted CopG family antitoxin